MVHQIVLAIAGTIFEPNTNFTVLFYPNSTCNLTITYTNTCNLYTRFIHVKVQVYYYVKNCMLQLVCLEDTSAKYHHIIVMLNLLDPPCPPYTQTMLHVGNSKCSTKFVWGILVQSYFSACSMPTDSMNYTIRVHACRLQL